MPKVAQMDETEQLDKDVLKGLFEQGVSAFDFFKKKTDQKKPLESDQVHWTDMPSLAYGH